jgi:hypothetical protein
MAVAEEVTILFKGQTAEAVTAVNQLNTKLGTVSDTANKISGVFKILSSGIYAAIAVQGVKAFVDLQKATDDYLDNKAQFDNLFSGIGESARRELVQGVANSLEISTAEATKFLSKVQDIQTGLGISSQRAAQNSEDILKIAKAYQEFGKGDVASNVEAINGALLGRTASLKQLNISLSETDIVNKAVESGYTLLDGKVDKATRAEIILTEVKKRSADASKALAEGNKSVGDNINTIAAKAADLKLALGLELNAALSGSSNGVVEFLNKFAKLENLQFIIKKAIQTFDVLKEVVITGGKIVAGVALAPLKVAESIFKVVQLIVEVAKSPKTVFEQLGNFLTDYATKIVNVFAAIPEALKGNLGGIKTAIKDLAEQSKGGLFDSNLLSDSIKIFSSIKKLVTDNTLAVKDEGKNQTQSVNEESEEQLEIKRKQYEQELKERQRIQDEIFNYTASSYDQERLAAQRKNEEILANDKLTNEERQRIAVAYGEKVTEINKKEAEDNSKKEEEKFKAAQSGAGKIIDIAKQAAQIIIGFVLRTIDTYNEFTAQLKEVDAERAAVEEQRATEDFNKNKEDLTESLQKETDVKKRAAIQQQLNRLEQDRAYNLKKAELQKKQEAEEKAIKKRQFEADKAARITMAIIDTAASVVEALPNIALAVVAGIMGAAQIAFIATTPTPEFAKGTDFAPGGMALVGEEGPELVNIPRGSQVLTAAQTSPLLSAARSGSSIVNQSTTQSQNDNSRIYNISVAANDPVEFINALKRKGVLV